MSLLFDYLHLCNIVNHLSTKTTNRLARSTHFIYFIHLKSKFSMCYNTQYSKLSVFSDIRQSCVNFHTMRISVNWLGSDIKVYTVCIWTSVMSFEAFNFVIVSIYTCVAISFSRNVKLNYCYE